MSGYTIGTQEIQSALTAAEQRGYERGKAEAYEASIKALDKNGRSHMHARIEAKASNVIRSLYEMLPSPANNKAQDDSCA